jgi:hypothetical protein
MMPTALPKIPTDFAWAADQDISHQKVDVYIMTLIALTTTSALLAVELLFQILDWEGLVFSKNLPILTLFKEHKQPVEHQ